VVFTQATVLEPLPDEPPREFIRRRRASERLFGITPDGRNVRALEPGEAGQLSRDRGLSPDGRWLAYSKAVEGSTGLYLQEQPSGTERLLDDGGRRP
jgi:Tol biopolymer transport system component